ncbi:MAG: 1-(5-phosphoribosyl)-5-[(5-phosphoribosylamino)methylideneamino] imidazole-4-carboxamide isomerase [Brockia lithotrophica]|nr:1-(5-phosphoribosyl)-5-[(5-phosphoribosylamino)methylideneamino] imidazole-4-carboxamide isomerase [Brockia lithotrophica]
MFTVFPALDILDGEVVSLVRGDPRERLSFGDPLEWADRLAAHGIPHIHLVDLGGAFTGTPQILPLVAQLKARGFRLQVGGGIRDLDTFLRYLSLGVDWPVVGTRALTDPAFLAEILARGGERVTVALDIRRGRVQLRGWTEALERDLADVARALAQAGVRRVLYTDVERDGTLSGVDLEGALFLAGQGFSVVLAGGVHTPEDVAHAQAYAPRGISGVVVGRAFLEGRIPWKLFSPHEEVFGERQT